MKVNFLINLTENPHGGGNQFLKALRKKFLEFDIYEEDPEKADIILFNSFPFREEYRFKQAYRLKRKKKLLIHRVDGPISKIRNKDLQIDKLIYKFNQMLADGTIYQSNWSKFENLKLGMKENINEIIISNTADDEIFFKKKENCFSYKNNKIKIIATSWSSNWRKGFRYYKFLDENLDFSKYEMTFLGNSPIKFRNIKWIKPVKSKDLAKILRQHDVYITASECDPCSNSLIEALICGLPSVALKDGGHPEIIGKAGSFFNDESEIIPAIEKITNNYDYYKANIDIPSIDEISRRYYNFIKKTYKDFKQKRYSLKKIRYFSILRLNSALWIWKIKNFSISNYLLNILKEKISIINRSFNLNKDREIKAEDCKKFSLISDLNGFNDLKWIYGLKRQIFHFINEIKSKKRRGFYHYSLTGDFLGENLKWGLGNSVFFLKIISILNLEEEFQKEIRDALKYILSFQRKNGVFYDPIINILSIPLRLYRALKNLDFFHIKNSLYKRAETRQTISTLALYNLKPKYEYKDFPKTIYEIDKYLNELHWEQPWGAGSHLSHLLFFLNYSRLKNKDQLINYTIKWVNKIQNKNDGFWYKSNPTIQQKINGAMKIITGLKTVNQVEFNYPEKIIDYILTAINDEHACDNFDICYVLKYCNDILNSCYRYTEIKDFALKRLKLYYKYYFPEYGGFSFNKNRADLFYYDALITLGKDEPDLHGTILFLWGICLIAQILGINNDLNFKESIL